MIYEWDSSKAAANERKHGVSFHEAKDVFLDPLAETFNDPDHSSEEQRFITIGMTTKQRIVSVAHAESGGDRVRIISGTRGDTQGIQCLPRTWP